MIGLAQEDDDAIYHEADRCMNWSHLAYVRIYWSLPTEGVVVLWTSCFICFDSKISLKIVSGGLIDN